jgi:nucleotide-binding universal stress UspA family protein
MKSLVLHIGADSGFESRLQITLDIARRLDSHIACVQPCLSQEFVAFDMAGGSHFIAQAYEIAEKARATEKIRVEKELANEGVNWDWQVVDGSSKSGILADASRLADLTVISLDAERKGSAQPGRSLIGDVMMMSRTPVLAVPETSKSFGFGTAMIAYDGSPEASFAIRCALPVLRQCAHVKLVQIGDDDAEFPMTDAAAYLARHGIESRIEPMTKGGQSKEERLISYARNVHADLLVMGAYGHSRWREAMFGGVTHYVMAQIGLPVLMAH